MKKKYCLAMVLCLIITTLFAGFTKETQAAAQIQLNATSVTTYVGYTYKLKLTGATGTVEWSSADKTIATVSSKGTVTGKKEGSTTITATCNKKKYTCTVKVKNASSGLAFSNAWGKDSYSVTGIGTCEDKEIVIPATYCGKKVTEIEARAFYGCEKITKVELPATLTRIGWGAFYWCKNLSGTIKIPKGVTEIGDYAFNGCEKITKVELPTTLTKIGSYAFRGCTNLSGTIKIPEGVTEIGDYAFDGCDKLTIK